MSTAAGFSHAPVLCQEIVDIVRARKPKLIVDSTLGGAGHASAMLTVCPDATLIGIDRDPAALKAAGERLSVFGKRARLVHAPFSEISRVIREQGLGPADAILVDLGVSSHQLDTPERGFSFRFEGPLDMRMDTTSGETVADILDSISQDELRDVIRTLGEERYAGRIARVILEEKPTTTAELAEVVRRIQPKGGKKSAIHPATRTFQALRMLANQELEELDAWLGSLEKSAAPGAVIMAMSFHSLEDRAVKQAFRTLCTTIHAEPYVPGREETIHAKFAHIQKKPVTASAKEIAANPRSRSAKLRVIRRLPSEGASS